MKSIPSQKLKSLNIVVTSHIFATGPALELEEYLKGKTKSLLFVGLPFSSRRDKRHFARYYKEGKLVDESFGTNFKLPFILQYFQEAFYVALKVIATPGNINLFVGSDNFNTFIGLIFKVLGKVDKVVLYTIDYLPKRFANPILNNIYHFFDRQCLKYCDIVWNVSPVMSSAREEFDGIIAKENASQIVVPLGVWYDRIPKLPYTMRKRYQLVFMGHILKKQGLDVVLEGLPKVLKELPKVNLVIIGTGDYEEELKERAKKLGIGKAVRFTGYIENHEEIENILAKSTLALAMYVPDPNSFTNWADPGKLKNYLAAGLPIVLTSVPPIAKELEGRRCALIAEYNSYDFANKVVSILTSNTKLQEYSKNSKNFAKSFDWNIIFKKALSQSL